MEGKSGDEFNRIMRGDERRRYDDGETEIEEEVLAPVDEYVEQRKQEPEEQEAENEEEVEVEVSGEPLNGMSSNGLEIKDEWNSPEDDSQEPLESFDGEKLDEQEPENVDEEE